MDKGQREAQELAAAKVETSDASNSSHTKDLAFGLFVANSGLGDRGFMDSIYQGALHVANKHNALLLMEDQLLDATAEEQAEVLGRLVKRGAELVFCSSSSMKETMDIAARRHPQTSFVLMDGMALEYLPNVSSASFATEQAAFLAGALSARMSQNKVLGVIGGTRVPAVMDFILGFEEGARHVLPAVKVKTVFIDDFDRETLVWNNPDKGRELAAMLHAEHGADVLFPVAGASGIGVFNHVQEHGLHAIGVDTDQDYLAPGRILTSVLKSLDVAVMLLAKKHLQGKLLPINYRFTLEDGGVELSEMQHTREMIPDEVHQELEQLRKDIIAGNIVVPSATGLETVSTLY